MNSIATSKGGTHVNCVLDQIVTKLVAVVKKKNKGEVVKPSYIKQHLFVFVSALIENPAFDSQVYFILIIMLNFILITPCIDERMLEYKSLEIWIQASSFREILETR